MKKSQNKDAEKKRQPRRKKNLARPRIMAIAAKVVLGKKLQKLHGQEIRYLVLAGESCKLIADELEIAEKYCLGDRDAARNGVGKAISGNKTEHFSRAYRALVNKKDRRRLALEAQRTAQRKRYTIDPYSCTNLDDLTEDQHPISPSTPEREFEQKHLEERLEQVLSTLRYREREVLKLRYGLFGDNTHTFEEISKIFQVGRERIRQIEKRALEKLEDSDNGGRLKSYLF